MFEVGQKYHNKFGEYTVLAIKGIKMDVEYLDGHRQTLPIETQVRIQERILRESLEPQRQVGRQLHRGRKPYHRIGDKAYWTMGFLFERLTRLSANLKGEQPSIDRYSDDYFETTGKRLILPHDGICVLREGANQQGNQGVIRFMADVAEIQMLEFSSDSEGHNTPYPAGDTENLYEVKDIRFQRFLFEHGFDLGNEQDKNTILDKIPLQYKKSFDGGCAYAQR